MTTHFGMPYNSTNVFASARLNVPSLLTNFLFLAGFFAFVPLLPLPGETQPVLAFLTGLGLIFVRLPRLAVKSFDVYLALFTAVTVVVYGLYAFLQAGSGAILTTGKFLLPLSAYLALRGNCKRLTKAPLVALSCFFTAYIVAYLCQPDSLRMFVQRLIPRSVITGRPTFLTPEPSYVAFSLMLFISLGFFLRLNHKISRDQLALLTVPAIVAGLLTGSALVYSVILISVGLIIFLTGKTAVRLALGCLFAVFALAFQNSLEQGSRVYQALGSIRQMIVGEATISDYMFRLEPSGSSRLILNFIGMHGLVDGYGFGNGIDTFQNRWRDIAHLLLLPIEQHEVLKTTSSGIIPHTYLTNLVFATGLCGLAVLGIMFCSNRRRKDIVADGLNPNHYRILKVFTLLSVLICLFFQSPITSPVPWLMIALLKRE